MVVEWAMAQQQNLQRYHFVQTPALLLDRSPWPRINTKSSVGETNEEERIDELDSEQEIYEARMRKRVHW